MERVARLAFSVLPLCACSLASEGIVIDRIQPSSGLDTEDVAVQIEGTGFRWPIRSDLDDGTTTVGNITVSIGNLPLANMTWQSDQLIEGVVAAGLAPGFYDVTIALGERTASIANGYEVTTVAPLGPWGTPTPVDVMMPGADDPTLTDDLLELYFNANGDVYVTTRSSLADAWSTPAVVAPLSDANETTPEVSYDGLTILVASDRAGTLGSTDIWMASRATRNDAFNTPTNVTELNSTSQDASSVMTPDGLNIVMTSQRGGTGGSDVYTSTRASTSDPWSAPIEQTALDTPGHEGSPFLTADGLTVYFDSDRSGNNDLYYSQRASVSDPFPAPIPLTDINTAAGEEDPWVSADGRHLFFYSDRDGTPGLWESAR